MISFAQALNQTDRKARHILLGNGFSQAVQPKTFLAPKDVFFVAESVPVWRVSQEAEACYG